MKVTISSICISFLFIFFTNTVSAQSNPNILLRRFWDDYVKSDLCSKTETNSEPEYKIFEVDGCKIIFFGTNHIYMDMNNYFQLDSLILQYRPSIYFSEAYAPTLESKDKSLQGDIFFMQYSAVDRMKSLYCWNDDYEDVFFNLSKKYGQKNVLVFRNIINDQFFNLKKLEDYRYLSLSFAIRDVVQTNRDLDFQYYLTEREKISLRHKNRKILNKNLLCVDEFRNMYVDYQCLRERQLIDNIQKAIPQNKTILIQAGFVHLRSFENIVKSGLLKGNNDFPQGEDSKLDLFALKQSAVKHWLLIRNNKIESSIIENDIGLAKLKDLIKVAHVNTILSNGSSIVSSDKSSFNSELRAAAIKKKIRVKNWKQNWAFVYPRLAKDFSYKDLFLFAYLKTIVENSGNLAMLKDNKEFDDFVYASLWSTGFPFQPSDHCGILDLYRYCRDINLPIPILNHNNIEEISKNLAKCVDAKIDETYEGIQLEHLKELILTVQSDNRYLVVEIPPSASSKEIMHHFQ